MPEGCGPYEPEWCHLDMSSNRCRRRADSYGTTYQEREGTQSVFKLWREERGRVEYKIKRWRH